MSEFKCGTCGEVFADEQELNMHSALLHGGSPDEDTTENNAPSFDEFDFSKYEVELPEELPEHPGEDTEDEPRPDDDGSSVSSRIREKDKKKLKLSAAVRKKLVLCFFCLAAAAALIVFVLIPAGRVAEAEKYYEAGDYTTAMDHLSGHTRGKNAFTLYGKAATAYGDQCLTEGKEIPAAVYYTKACRPNEAEQIFDFRTVVMGYSYVTAGISQLGNAYYSTNREGDSGEAGLQAVCEMQKFLPSTAGINGLDPTGSPVLHPLDNTGKIYLSEETLAELSGMTDISDAVSDTDPTNGHSYVALLGNDGSVKVVSDGTSPLTSTASWKKITRIYDGGNKLFGIDYAGKLYVAYEKHVEKKDRYDISGLSAAQKVVETGKAVIVLTVSGELQALYGDTEFRYDYDFSKAKNVSDIAANNNILVICFRDGSVKALRIPNWISDGEDAQLDKLDRAVRAVSRWKNIVRVRFAANGIYGIRCDGKVSFTSCAIKYNSAKNRYIFNPQFDVAKEVAGWTDVADVISCTTHAVALRYDGTAVSTGNTTYLERKYTTPSSDTYSYVKKNNGIYADVSEWKLW